MSATKVAYPHKSGDYTVLGPECFTDAHERVIAYRGAWFYRGADGVRPHVVELFRQYDGEWTWVRKGGNRAVVAESHRTWARRSEAERNLQAVNAKPFRLEVLEAGDGQ